MLKRAAMSAALLIAGLAAGLSATPDAAAAEPGQPPSWERFYYYPYVYYPHSFQQGPQSYNHLYYRYPPERQIPVYRTDWHNFYPSARPYHSGHHFILDVF